jgi:hypothetical protein
MIFDNHLLDKVQTSSNHSEIKTAPGEKGSREEELKECQSSQLEKIDRNEEDKRDG